MLRTSVLCLLFYQFMMVQPKIQYNTHPTPGYSVATTYTPSVVTKMCLLKPDKGPCRYKIRMYYYDPKTMNCTKFTWGGCQGNGNRFDTRAQCLSTCQSDPNEKTYQPRYCQLAFDYGFCFGASERWYYDRFWKVCKKTIYSGCGGNKNNFYKKEQCDRVCRLGKSPLRGSKRTSDRGNKKILIINPESKANTTKTSKTGVTRKIVKRISTTPQRYIIIDQ